MRIVRANADPFWARIEATAGQDVDGMSMVRITISDIAGRKQAEDLQKLAAEILGILNAPSALTDTISHILTAIKRKTGFEAVGIRLRDGDDFPYFVQEGFSNDFLLTENTLVIPTQDGGFCRDKDGHYSLECTCGLVISGQTDPINPLFTPGGSAWTNNLRTLLDLPPNQDPRLHPRNRCIHEGFRSVALIPIREDQEIIGLLQLNDREKGRLTLDMIHFFEGISASIGVALKRKQADEALRQTHNELERRVEERTSELRTANEQLGKEIKEHRQDEESLRQALSEIKSLKDRLEAENIYFRQEAKKKQPYDHILGQSDGLKYVLYRAEQVAPQNTTVLILGETGTGKELIAAVIHNLSPRRDRPLITVNCATLPANLIESELFGREKGAFTGADTRQIGRFEIAHGSTLCLDEIGELPLELQAKLLRVIQHNEFERLGSSKTIKVDVRIVATTNRNLEEEVRKGRFRQDLYYRINVFPITVPPLRQRQEDIPLLVQAFTERYARKLGKQITSIQKETMKALQDYHWPGNIRELESIIERAVILCPGPVLQLTDKLEIASLPFSAGMNTLEESERNQILNTLAETRWRLEGKNGAAAILGLHPSTLRARMHKLGIARPKIKDSD